MLKFLSFLHPYTYSLIDQALPFVHLPFLSQRRQWQPTPVLLPGKSHGWRSLVGCIPWGREESDTTERLDFHFSLSCIGEGNGNPLQCSCLENPRDREPGGLPSVGSHRVGHDWSDLAAAAFLSIYSLINIVLTTPRSQVISQLLMPLDIL